MESSCSGNLDGDPTPKRRRHADGDDAGEELLSALLNGDHGGKDLLSALPDELLIAILERADSRTAVSTSALSRRWRRLDPAGCLSAFEFSVAIHLPTEYAGAVDNYRDARARGGGGDELAALAERVGGCEDRAMEAYVRGLACFLRAPERCPRARSLRLEFFVTPREAVAGGETAACLASAVRWSRLECLAVDAVPRAAAGREQRPHLFPEAALVPGPAAPALDALRVTNCFLSTDGHVYGTAFPALARLTVELTPRVARSFESAYFNNLMLACEQLVSLRLVSCDLFDKGDGFTVDLPPPSRLQELIIETCDCAEVKLVNAPSLERLVLERCNHLWVVRVESAPRLETLVCRGSVPRLCGSGKESLRFVKLSVLDPTNGEYRLASFFRAIPNVEELTLCFRGRMIWIEPENFQNTVQNLKKLLIDLPRLWSLQWMNRILEIAPCLEKLHIHIFEPSSETLKPGDTSCDETSNDFQHTYPTLELGDTSCDETTVDFQHTCLKEIEMVGFEGAEQQLALIRLFMSSCSVLKTVILIRQHALLEDKFGRQGGISCPSWLTEDEKAEIISQLRLGIHSDADIFLG